jgi:two-component system LytT family sensor kinase
VIEAASLSKEEILAKYDGAVTRADELRVWQDDVFRIIPRIRLAADALLREDFAEADILLDEVVSDLKLVESRRPAAFRTELRIEWLEIYSEIIQKYAIVILLAYLITLLPSLRQVLARDALQLQGRIWVPVMLLPATLLLSLIDLGRYGESAWAFLDIEVILVTATGLLGGLWSGLASGLAVAAFRWSLKPEVFIYAAIVLAAGILGGLFSQHVATFRRMGKASFACGALAGLAQGLGIYLPLWGLLTRSYLAASIALLALLEGLGVFLFFAVISAVLRERDRRQIEQELLKTKFLFLQAQTSPHFLYNALNTIAAVCRRENAGEARGLILSLARFLRRTLKRVDETVSLKEEMDYIDAYLEIERARFQERLNVRKEISLREDSWQAKIPLLILQPLVENAVKHGISKKENGGTLTIKLADGNGGLTVEIEDDGVGFQPAELERERTSEDGTGIGLKNIDARLKHLYGRENGLEFHSEPGKGTRVLVKIPLKKTP